MSEAPGARMAPGTRPAVTTRVRVRFTKLGKIRWTSHRDVARMWERAVRRLQLPVAYSGGFAPRPKVSFGLALPTGHESLAEYLDIELAQGAAADAVVDALGQLPARLSSALPAGVDATVAEVVAPGTPSLQEMVGSCTWAWTVVACGGPAIGEAELAERVDAVLAATTLTVTRLRKGAEVTDDIRAGIADLRVVEPGPAGTDHGPRLTGELTATPRSVRPSEVVAALGADLVERDTRRIIQWTSRDGARCEPLTARAAATDAPHALERVS